MVGQWKRTSSSVHRASCDWSTTSQPPLTTVRDEGDMVTILTLCSVTQYGELHLKGFGGCNHSWLYTQYTNSAMAGGGGSDKGT